MLLLEVYVTERWRDNLIIICIFLSLFTTFLSFIQICAGLCSISIYDAPLTALEKRGEQDLAYILIVAGLTGCLMHTLGMAVCWSQRFINKRTIGYTRLMTLLAIIMMLQIVLEVASVVLNHKASSMPIVDRNEGFLRAMHKYGFDGIYKRAMDETQQRFQCCGNENFKDWLEIRWFPRDYSMNKISKEVPFTCCRRDSQPPCHHDDVLSDLHKAFKTNDEGLITINRKGCLEVFYQDYSNFIVFGVCIPCCFKIVMLFFLVPIFRYIDTSIYRAIKTGFPQSAEYGYLLAFYEPSPKPKKMTKTDQRVMSMMSLSSIATTTPTDASSKSESSASTAASTKLDKPVGAKSETSVPTLGKSKENLLNKQKSGEKMTFADKLKSLVTKKSKERQKNQSNENDNENDNASMAETAMKPSEKLTLIQKLKSLAKFNLGKESSKLSTSVGNLKKQSSVKVKKISSGNTKKKSYSERSKKSYSKLTSISSFTSISVHSLHKDSQRKSKTTLKPIPTKSTPSQRAKK